MITVCYRSYHILNTIIKVRYVLLTAYEGSVDGCPAAVELSGISSPLPLSIFVHEIMGQN